jgi:hypothetical protein
MSVCTRQSWNSAASFNWSDADNVPCTSNLAFSALQGFDHQWRDRAEGQTMLQLGAPAVGVEFLHVKPPEAKDLDRSGAFETDETTT